MPESERLSFRIGTLELIALDTHAKNAGMNRTEFIRNALDAQINKARLEAVAKREGSDLQKIYQAIAEMNTTMVAMRDQLENLDNKKLKRLFERIGRIEERLKI